MHIYCIYNAVSITTNNLSNASALVYQRERNQVTEQLEMKHEMWCVNQRKI